MSADPRMLEQLEAGSVALIAPHADDEVIGAGGTLALHRRAGASVSVLVLFDGKLGLAPGADARVRRDETRRAGAHLGVDDYTFWDYPEGHEPGPEEWEAAVTRLAQWLGEREPQVVYAPWAGEHHRDHALASRAARAGLERVGFRGPARAYEVWTPLAPEQVVDITPVWSRKRDALAEFKSQLAHTDLVHMALGLAAHRSVYLPRGPHGAAGAATGPRYAEAFGELSAGADSAGNGDA